MREKLFKSDENVRKVNSMEKSEKNEIWQKCEFWKLILFKRLIIVFFVTENIF